MGEVDDGVDRRVDGLQQVVGADDVRQPLEKKAKVAASRCYVLGIKRKTLKVKFSFVMNL